MTLISGRFLKQAFEVRNLCLAWKWRNQSLQNSSLVHV